MHKTFSLKNFRCFEDLTLDDLTRVNLLTGKNNVGKTALLEGMFLHAGPANPSLPTHVNVMRGIEQYSLDAEEIWGWLFFRKNMRQPIEIAAVDSAHRETRLLITLGQPEVMQLPGVGNALEDVDSNGSTSTENPTRDLVLRYVDESGASHLSNATVTTEGKLEGRPAHVEKLPQTVFLTSRARHQEDDARRFSNLQRVGQDDFVIEAVRLIEPRVKRIGVLLTGGRSLLNADVGLPEWIPLRFLGEGVGKLLTIVLAIADSPGGKILIDETENGFHYSVMPLVWRVIADVAARRNVQVFATSHSWECVNAAHEVFRKIAPESLRLYRLEKVKDVIRHVSYNCEAFDAAMVGELEVR